MTDITIPPQAELAALRAYVKEAEANAKLGACLRAACLAMIKSWPGVHIANVNRTGQVIELPYPPPQENQNDKG